MQAKFHTTNIDDVEFTLTIQMKLKDWVRLLEQTSGHSDPGWELKRQISLMVTAAATHFHPKTEEASQ